MFRYIVSLKLVYILIFSYLGFLSLVIGIETGLNKDGTNNCDNCTNYEVCNPIRMKCVCAFGTKLITDPSTNKSECHQIQCTNDNECLFHFGSNVHCNLTNNRCICDDRFYIDPIISGCRSMLNGPCNSTNDCGYEAGCYQNRCQCRFGDLPHSNGFGCVRSQCQTDVECQQMLNQNETKCRRHNEYDDEPSQTYCDCFPIVNQKLFVTDQRKQTCELFVPLKCTSSSNDCGQNSTCYKSTCRCHFGMIPLDQHSADCGEFYCYENDECEVLFANTRCDQSIHRCVCKQWYSLDNIDGTCKEEINYFVCGVIAVGIVIFIGPIIFFALPRLFGFK